MMIVPIGHREPAVCRTGRLAERAKRVSVRFAVIASLGAAFSHASEPPSGAAAPIRVATFNLRGDFDEGVPTDKPHAWLSTTGEPRREASMRLVRRLDADLLGVQEAYANQVADLRAALPDHDDYGVGRDDGDSAGEHCSIFYRNDRFTLIDRGTFWLGPTPETPSKHPDAACPRIATWVVLRDEPAGRGLLVLNTHWDHVSPASRRDAARQVRDWLAGRAGPTPTIVVGDLNTHATTEPLVTLTDGTRGTPLIDAHRAVHPEHSSEEATYHGYQGTTEGRRIDFVLSTKHFRALHSEIVRQKVDGRLVSDHYPVAVTLRWSP